MPEEVKPSSNRIKTIKEYFDFRPGDKITDFAAEFKALTDEDKQQLCDGIVDETFDY